VQRASLLAPDPRPVMVASIAGSVRRIRGRSRSGGTEEAPGEWTSSRPRHAACDVCRRTTLDNDYYGRAPPCSREVLLVSFCVAVIDDDADVLRVVRIKLERAGFRVATAGDAAAGLDLVRRRRPDVAIVDLMLPDRDGLDLVRDLAGLPPDEAPVVLILSARTGLDAIERGIGAGADDYVTKPFSPTELIERVWVALVRRGRTGPPRERGPLSGPATGPDLPVVADDEGT